MTATFSAGDLVAQALARLGVGESRVFDQPVPDVCDWAEKHFYIPETGRPIEFQPHQREILRLMFEQQQDALGRWSFRWRTALYSTIKKSGKTTISAVVARWAAETWGPYQEVYNLGNKLGQAKDRAFKMIKRSIQLGPPGKRDEWTLQETQMTHKPSGSIIKALPVSDEGEAGSNPSLSVWTELWGFQYEEALRFWDEYTPVATRPRSVRFVDTYAGYEGESELLKTLWGMALNDDGTMADSAIRLHETLPIYGVPSAGLIAYIDQGEAARRMPWQQGEEGERYYAEQQASERAANYDRLHNNYWVSSQGALFPTAMWDRLAEPPYTLQKGDVVVAGADASVSGDYTALTVVAVNQQDAHVIAVYVWEPPVGGKLDYDADGGLKPTLRDVLQRWPVVSVPYDEYQLHDVMTQMAKEFSRVEFYPFGQTSERLKADTALVNRVRRETLYHNDDAALNQAARNADGKISGDDDAVRIVKRALDKKIDPLVAVSMAAYHGAELVGKPRKQAGMQQVKVKW